MPPENRRYAEDRAQTDESLRLEREKADHALEEQLAAIDETADAVISRARTRADEVLAETREHTDRQAAAAGATARRMNQLASTGTTVRETKREATSATVTVTANGRNNSPAWPPTIPMGRKTATVVSVEDVTAPATSFTAVTIAACPVCPSDACRLMFSMTTMESSTTRPMATVRAPSVRMFRV